VENHLFVVFGLYSPTHTHDAKPTYLTLYCPLFHCGSQMYAFFDGFAKIDNSLGYYKQEIKRGLCKPNESRGRKKSTST
jgi:hypothetical protein